MVSKAHAPVRLSIVTSMYRSARHLDEFHRRVSAAAGALTADYEIILVDDGSPDDSRDLAAAIAARDPCVVLIELSRNFGHHRAMMTGLAHARGQSVFLLDCDLEEQPEWLPEFARTLEQSDADVVYGVQDRRKGGWFERLSGRLFYRIFNLLSDYPIPADVVTARLMRRRYVRSLVRHRDREPFIAGLWAMTGFRQVPVTVQKAHSSETTYSLTRRVTILVDAITSFSRRPLILIFYLGAFIIAAAALGAAWLIYYRLTSGFLPGWASLIVSVWMLGGLTIFCTGLIGVYLSRIFVETKRRPYTVVRRILRHAAVRDGTWATSHKP